MSGRKRIIVAKITDRKLRGKDLAEALDEGLNADEKNSNYQNEKIKDDK